MYIKILSKLRNTILPCFTLGTSTIFFFAIGFFFGINEKSDFILFTITLLSTIGTILQISWYGLLPRLSSSSSLKFLGYIISNGFIYCLIINILPFVILTMNFTNFFLQGVSTLYFSNFISILRMFLFILGGLKHFIFLMPSAMPYVL